MAVLGHKSTIWFTPACLVFIQWFRTRARLQNVHALSFWSKFFRKISSIVWKPLVRCCSSGSPHDICKTSEPQRSRQKVCNATICLRSMEKEADLFVQSFYKPSLPNFWAGRISDDDTHKSERPLENKGYGMSFAFLLAHPASVPAIQKAFINWSFESACIRQKFPLYSAWGYTFCSIDQEIYFFMRWDCLDFRPIKCALHWKTSMFVQPLLFNFAVSSLI